jgi:hypothetical protein
LNSERLEVIGLKYRRFCPVEKDWETKNGLNKIIPCHLWSTVLSLSGCPSGGRPSRPCGPVIKFSAEEKGRLHSLTFHQKYKVSRKKKKK